MIGHTIGPYRISDKLGEGGMGEVYRARDTNLQRDVAIKVLPDAWAGDADRLARFRREAQLLASLNHPHIAQVYGIGHWDAAWMPDSRRLLFSGGPALTGVRIVSKAADGSGAATVVTPPPGGFPNAVSPDGKHLIYHRGVGELMVQPFDPVPARPLIEGAALNGVFSPDGSWIAYQAGLAGRSEIHVVAFPDASAGRSQVSSGGGRYPLWSPDGRELFFIDAAGFLTAVTVDSRRGFATGPPRPLFRTDRYDVNANSRPFDISHDGKRFVFAKPAADAARPTIHVVINWLQEMMANVSAQQSQSRQ